MLRIGILLVTGKIDTHPAWTHTPLGFQEIEQPILHRVNRVALVVSLREEGERLVGGEVVIDLLLRPFAEISVAD